MTPPSSASPLPHGVCRSGQVTPGSLALSPPPPPQTSDMGFFSSTVGVGGKLAVEVVKERLKSMGGSRSQNPATERGSQQAGAVLQLWGPRPTGLCALHTAPWAAP